MAVLMTMVVVLTVIALGFWPVDDDACFQKLNWNPVKIGLDF
jgi:hypothetical protein